MDSQDFAQEYPWISRDKAFKIAARRGLDDDLWADLGVEVRIKTGGDQVTTLVNTASLLLWLGY